VGEFEFRFPDVGEGLEEGEVVAWLVAPGDAVWRDQPLVELQTDKSMVELPSPGGSSAWRRRRVTWSRSARS
jgi:pyruvate dehydrogenase E2 component (dihydrolipoamide acetyltransferase)